MAGRYRPGIRRLHRLISQHGEAIEADLLRQGLDIRDLGGALSYRRLAVILENSPDDSAYGRAVLGESDGWTLTDHLLAIVIDRLTAANWQRGAKSPRPKPFPRPGARSEGRRIGGTTVMTTAECDAWLATRRTKEA